MSYRFPVQYEAKKITFEEFTKIFQKSLLLQTLAVAFAGSVATALQILVFSSRSDSDMVTSSIGVLFATLSAILFLLFTKSAWKDTCEKREVAFLVDQIKEKYDTAGMTFKDRFQNHRRVVATQVSESGSPIEVTFAFDPETNDSYVDRNYDGQFAYVRKSSDFL